MRIKTLIVQLTISSLLSGGLSAQGQSVDEAMKTISQSPKWTPGLQRGEPVRVRYSIPLIFRY